MAQQTGKNNTAYKHGFATQGKRPAIYWRWRHMVARCHEVNDKSYPRYGAKGILVCDRWRWGDGEYSGFTCWLNDMGPIPFEKASIERVDNSKGYSPDNCRWASVREQANNKSTNRWVEARGQKLTIAQWARVVGIGPKTIRYRLEQGLDPEIALFTKPHHGNKLIGQMSKIQGNKS